MKFKAVLFDLDGTLLDTLADLANSMNTVLENFNFPIHPIESYKSFVGEGVEYLAMMALPAKERQDSMIQNCVQAMRKEYQKRWNELTQPYPGIPELLDELAKRQVKLSILSNKPHDFTKIIVEQFLPKWKFKVVLGAQNTLPKKPHPKAALQIAKEMEEPPEKIIFLGDTKIDMETAVTAGMYAIGALWGFRTREELLQSGAKSLIQKPEELLNQF
ncbi:MAG: HAD family hydrolase [Chlamydiae bacterium]|nr:HAD family hydrolase [Chlamydiota bacterium]MBI3277024.1 HAD family hydrolase [Chlamydiota bacterium]